MPKSLDELMSLALAAVIFVVLTISLVNALLWLTSSPKFFLQSKGATLGWDYACLLGAGVIVLVGALKQCCE